MEARLLIDIIVDKIIQWILENDMQPGDRLPNEFEMAQTLGVGRSTLREAIRCLVSRNVLEVRQGAGTFISDKKGVPEDPLGLTFIKDSSQLALELSEVRLMMEPEIAERAAVRASAEQLELLEEYCAEIESLITQGQDYCDADVKMHSLIATMSGNSVLQNLIPIIASSVCLAVSATDEALRLQTIKLHRKLVDAIRARDPVEARRAMIMHLYTSRQTFEQAYAESREEAARAI